MPSGKAFLPHFVLFRILLQREFSFSIIFNHSLLTWQFFALPHFLYPIKYQLLLSKSVQSTSNPRHHFYFSSKKLAAALPLLTGSAKHLPALTPAGHERLGRSSLWTSHQALSLFFTFSSATESN